MSARYGATRRFYNAFYRWHVVSNRQRCCRTLSTTSRCKEASPFESLAPSEKTRRENIGTKRLDLSSADDPPARAVEKPPKFVMEQLVETSSERPFDTMRDWQEAVRYRSDVGALLQMAIPRRAMPGLLRRMNSIRHNSGALLELGSTITNNGVELRSLTISGTFKEILRARVTVRADKEPGWLLGSPQTEAQKPSSSLVPWDRIVREAHGEHRMVEIVLPWTTWQRFCHTFEPRGAKHGVDIEVGTEHPADLNRAASLVRRQSILISGPCQGVHTATAALFARPPIEAQSDASATTDTSSKPHDSGTSSEQRDYSMLLSIPKGPNGEDRTIAIVIGHKGSTLARLKRKFRLKTVLYEKNGTQLLWMSGPTEDDVRGAKSDIQELVYEACAHANISPVEVQELKSGLTYPKTESLESRTQGHQDNGSSADKTSPAVEETFGTIDSDAPYRVVLAVPPGLNGNTAVDDSIFAEWRSNIDSVRRSFHVDVSIQDRRLQLTGRSVHDIFAAKQALFRAASQRCHYMRSPFRRPQVLESNLPRPTNPDKRKGLLDVQSAASDSPTVQSKDVAEPAETQNTEDVKLALRALSHPVVLVTSLLSSSATVTRHDDLLPFCRGVTVSSFSSVTLSPHPIISFNIRTPSRSWDAISSSGFMRAHILTATPGGAALAHAFTLPYERPDEPFWRARRLGAAVMFDARRAETFRQQKGKQTPRLAMTDAISATIVAKLLRDKCTQVGDHMIVVAEATKVHFSGQDMGRRRAESAAGLTYAKRGYRSVGDEVHPAEERSPDPGEVLSGGTGPARVVKAQEPAAGEMNSSTSDEVSDHYQARDFAQPPAAEAHDARTAERTNLDYFEAIQEDDGDDGEESASPPDPQRKKVEQEEEEYDFGFAEDDVTYGIGSQSTPLVEDSAAAHEERASESDRADSVVGRKDEAREHDERANASKRSAAESRTVETA